MEDLELSIPETTRYVKVNHGSDGSKSCKSISDFGAFMKVIMEIWNVFHKALYYTEL